MNRLLVCSFTVACDIFRDLDSSVIVCSFIDSLRRSSVSSGFTINGRTSVNIGGASSALASWR